DVLRQARQQALQHPRRERRVTAASLASDCDACLRPVSHVVSPPTVSSFKLTAADSGLCLLRHLEGLFSPLLEPPELRLRPRLEGFEEVAPELLHRAPVVL